MAPRARRFVATETPETPEAAAQVLFRQWSEDDLLRYCRTAALALGWRFYHTKYSLKSTAGFPDLFLCRPPRIILAELKREGKWPTEGRFAAGLHPRWVEGQRDWLVDLAACPGVETYLWWPSDTGDITTILQDGADPAMPCVRRLTGFLVQGLPE